MNKLTGNGRPTVHTHGEVGQYYEDLETGDIYECRRSSEFSPLHGAPVGGYIWELRAKGEDIKEHDFLIGDMVEREAVIVNETTATGKYVQFNIEYGIKPDRQYTVVYNGTEYKCNPKIDMGGDLALGNLKLAKSTEEDTGEPFIFTGMSTGHMMSFAIFADATGSHTFSVIGPADIPVPISEDAIPTTVPVIRYATVGQTIAVKAVDENGKPTEWEAVNGGSGRIVTFYVGDDEYLYYTMEGAYDSAEINRVTKDELVENLEKNTVIMLGSVGLYSNAVECRSRAIPSSFDWSMNPYVTVYIGSGDDRVAYYTAEYTPGPV